MGTGIPQTAFTAGELAPSLYGRVDLARYLTGLKTCRNFMVMPYGGVANRPGTRMLAEVKDNSKRSRLIPFQFSAAQSYALEFGEHSMRVFMGDTGEQVVFPAGHLLAGQPYEIATPWGTDDLPLLKYTQSADVMTLCHPNYRQRQLSRLGHADWRLDEFVNVNGPFHDLNTDESVTVTASGTNGAITLAASSDLFTASHAGQMMYLEQSPDNSTRKWEVQKAIAINDIRRAGANYYKALTGGTTGTVRPSATEGTECDGDPGVSWLYLHSGFGIVRIDAVTSARSAGATVVKTLPANVMADTGAVGITNIVVSPYIGDNVAPAFWVQCSKAHGFPNRASVTITGVEGIPEANGTFAIVTADQANVFVIPEMTTGGSYTGGGTANLSTAPTPSYKWAFEAWNRDDGYPGSAAYYQQRQIFAGSGGQPQTLWGSRTQGYRDFGAGVPILDDDAFTFTIASRQVNEIRHIVELTELLLMTSDGVWTLKGSQDGVLTPASANTKRQGAYGSAHVPPVAIGPSALYVQAGGSQVRGIGYSFQDDAYIGKDLTVMSAHLFRGKEIVAWAYQCLPCSCVWAVQDDGSLIGFTYLQEQEIAGWHRHDSVNGSFESVCSVSGGREDSVFFIVRRVIGGVVKRYVEKLETRSFAGIADAFFVDSGLTYDGRNRSATAMTISGGVGWDETESLSLTASTAFFTAEDVGDRVSFTHDGTICKLTITALTSPSLVSVAPDRTIPAPFRATPFTAWSLERNVFAGLGHLEGQTVAILADGNVHAPRTVRMGAVTLDYHAAVVHAGLPITAEAGTLNLTVPGQNILDSKKLITKVTLICEASRGIMVGPDAAHLREHKGTVPLDGGAAPPVTGAFEVLIPAAWDKNGTITVRQADPLPLAILALIPDVTLGGN
ncbi:hypothetical protein F6V30_09355 [Oryzomonas sagensis]|uniref:Uncharacterized protein n=1 Tax=Oryzomonas sagensis TaxID=2603857 RepID=A0ABQ6TNY9_9BACT|nr:hypothetical protein [Oryzomonas sagensis]KAB0670349.1 hypothetical protein F6V30_09355 [Oryzomonas sagensis]